VAAMAKTSFLQKASLDHGQRMYSRVRRHSMIQVRTKATVTVTVWALRSAEV
jgi:hypothetical protein